MTDDELAEYLCLNPGLAAVIIPKLTPAARATYDRMKQVEIEASLWVRGRGPKPANVLLDLDRRKRRK